MDRKIKLSGGLKAIFNRFVEQNRIYKNQNDG